MPTPIVSKDWISRWLIKILFEEETGITFYNYKYCINTLEYYDFDANDLKEKIQYLNAVQKINFIYNLKELMLDVLDELLKSLEEHFIQVNKLDQFYWESINIVGRYNFDTLNLMKKKSYIQNFKQIGMEFIKSSFLTSIQQYVSFSLPYENRSVLRGANSIIDYYLTGLFSADEWLSLLPENYQLDDKLIKIHAWLKEISKKGREHRVSLDYLSVFGQDFRDFRMSSGLVVN